MTTNFVCPDCGSPIFIDEHAETERNVYHQLPPGTMPYLQMTRRPCVVAFCSGCEFCVEIVTQK